MTQEERWPGDKHSVHYVAGEQQKPWPNSSNDTPVENIQTGRHNDKQTSIQHQLLKLLSEVQGGIQ
jgi:hypothetical protein